MKYTYWDPALRKGSCRLHYRRSDWSLSVSAAVGFSVWPGGGGKHRNSWRGSAPSTEARTLKKTANEPNFYHYENKKKVLSFYLNYIAQILRLHSGINCYKKTTSVVWDILPYNIQIIDIVHFPKHILRLQIYFLASFAFIWPRYQLSDSILEAGN